LIALVPSARLAVGIAALVVLAHLTWQVTVGVLVVDLFPPALVATACGLVAVGSGIGGVVSTNVVGHLVTSYSYLPVFAIMGVLHPIALILVLRIREQRQTTAVG
jgi:ACS family hexuronate transporter-like MFS transporter